MSAVDMARDDIPGKLQLATVESGAKCVVSWFSRPRKL